MSACLASYMKHEKEQFNQNWNLNLNRTKINQSQYKLNLITNQTLDSKS